MQVFSDKGANRMFNRLGKAEKKAEKGGVVTRLGLVIAAYKVKNKGLARRLEKLERENARLRGNNADNIRKVDRQDSGEWEPGNSKSSNGKKKGFFSGFFD